MTDNGTEPTETEGMDKDLALDILKNLMSQRRSIDDHVTLESGIVLRLRPVSEITLRAVVQAIPLPKVPTEKFGKEGEEVEEPWPESPQYKSDLATAMTKRNEALARACPIVGTSVETVPDGYFLPEQDDWLDVLRLVGIDVTPEQTATPMDRYALWLDHHALSEFFDRNKVVQSVLLHSAIMEDEVLDTIRFFLSDDSGAGLVGDAIAQGDDPDGRDVRTPDARPRDRDGAARHGERSTDTMDDVDQDGQSGKGERAGVSKDEADGKPAPKRRRRKRVGGKSKAG